MAKKIFQNKKEILKFLGKNEKDTRLIDRMIVRKEIVKVGGGYELVQKEDIRELRKRIGELERELGNRELEISLLQSESKSNEDIDEIKADRDHWKNKAELYKETINLVIRITYNTVKPIVGNRMEEYEDFREAIMNSVTAQLRNKDK